MDCSPPDRVISTQTPKRPSMWSRSTNFADEKHEANLNSRPCAHARTFAWCAPSTIWTVDGHASTSASVRVAEPGPTRVAAAMQLETGDKTAIQNGYRFLGRGYDSTADDRVEHRIKSTRRRPPTVTDSVLIPELTRVLSCAGGCNWCRVGLRVRGSRHGTRGARIIFRVGIKFVFIGTVTAPTIHDGRTGGATVEKKRKVSTMGNGRVATERGLTTWAYTVVIT